MRDLRVIVAAVIALAALWYAHSQKPTDSAAKKEPARPILPKPEPEPKKPRPGPWGDCGEPVGFTIIETADAGNGSYWIRHRPAGAKVAGNVAPDGTPIQVDLPSEMHRRNTASKGLGNCVFTSIHHSALWQNEPALQEFPKWLIEKGIPGGGYPSKVADLIPKISKDRGLTPPAYVQIERADWDTLRLAMRCGRFPAVTYSKSPTGRYGGSRISHMVSMSHCDDKWIAILDNNYPGADKYEWMSPDEAKAAGCLEWVFILLAPPPPPPPKSGGRP